MIAALLLLATAPGVDIDATDCDDNSPQQMLNICAANAAQAADHEMNLVWKRVAAEMKLRDSEIDRKTDREPGFFDTLLASQRAWLTYRDKHCLLASFEMRGGSGAAQIHGGCFHELTRARIAQLTALIETGN
jgi:uncharacterized protein YecT (DUF1311 family)